jgi:peptidoglycan/LPS O-acetylase OafA/YrhL
MIGTLSALRFFAIVLIYFHHLAYPGGLGAAAVTFFFALSGFLMAYSYSTRFVSLDREQIRSFYLRRLSRVYPLHILTFLIAIPIVYVTNFKTNIFYALSNIFLVQSFFPNGNQVFSFNSLAWFLSDLVLFYLLTPFILFLLNKSQMAGNLMKLLALLLFLLFCEAALGLMVNPNMEPFSFQWWFIYISPFFRIFDYMIGLVTGMIFISRKDWLSHPVPLTNRILFSALEIITILFFAYSFAWRRFFPYPALHMGAYFLPFSLFIIFVFAFQRGILSAILSTKFFVYLGELSFSIYLLHQLAINYTAAIFASPISGMTDSRKTLAAQLILLFVVICLSDITFRYFEQPVKSWLIHKAENNSLPKESRLNEKSA